MAKRPAPSASPGSSAPSGAPQQPSSSPVPGLPCPPEPRFIKRCECGRAYSLEAWRRLRFVGFQRLEDDDLATELRNCAGCQSAIGIVVHVVPCLVARLGERG